MKRFVVDLSPEAIGDITNIGDYISERASPQIASDFVERILAKIASLADAPQRGTKRDDMGGGYRTFGIERRATVLFRVDEKTNTVTIAGVFYGGRAVEKR